MAAGNTGRSPRPMNSSAPAIAPLPADKQRLLDRRPFAPDSFWNQPIEAGAVADPESERLCRLLDSWSKGVGFHINLQAWTIPVYEAGPETPGGPARRIPY